MKKLFLGSIALCCFSLSIVLFQASCKKEAVANAPLAGNLGKIIYLKEVNASVYEIWTCNYDGSQKTKLNVTLPANTTIDEDVAPKLSPDGQKVFFGLRYNLPNINKVVISVVNIDGSNLTDIVDNGSNTYVMLADVN